MPPSAPIDHNPAIPSELNDLILKCLEKNPADRFQTARDLKYSVELILKKLAPSGLPHLKQNKPPGETDFDTIF